jgi:hypothetical protein
MIWGAPSKLRSATQRGSRWAENLRRLPDAVEEYFGQVLALSEHPSGFPHEYLVVYRQEPELVIEHRLPQWKGSLQRGLQVRSRR